ncbi:hypothetical protein [Oceanisphaera sp. KMM 10153]|uniref:hypothetical protein n=1 Tax=Oceanisphaera submarina TaxID=3390193 RepID=UPI003974EDDC
MDEITSNQQYFEQRQLPLQNSLFIRTKLHNVDFSEPGHFNINVLENTLTKARFSRYEALSLLENLGIELVD